jgi:hypothetical protein
LKILRQQRQLARDFHADVKLDLIDGKRKVDAAATLDCVLNAVFGVGEGS